MTADTDKYADQQHYIGPAVGIWRSAVGDGKVNLADVIRVMKLIIE